MGEERVTYAEVRVHSSSKSPRTPDNSKTEGFMCSEPRGYSVRPSSWKLISAVLWIICLVLLVTVVILATKLPERCSGNLISSQNTNQTELISGIPPLRAEAQGCKCHPCEDNWHQHGENCYSLATNLLTWKECGFHCSTSSSSFLKLNTEKEMDFVKNFSKMQCQNQVTKFWISLYYNSTQQKWVWLDGSAFTLDKLQLKKPVTASHQCIHIRNGQLLDAYCQDRGYCICKKTTNGD